MDETRKIIIRRCRGAFLVGMRADDTPKKKMAFSNAMLGVSQGLGNEPGVHEPGVPVSAAGVPACDVHPFQQ